MGKKKKNKSFYNNSVQPFFADNKVLFAALGGLAAGISIATILGTDKAKEIANTLGNAAKDYSERLKHSFQGEQPEVQELDIKPRKRATAAETV